MSDENQTETRGPGSLHLVRQCAGHYPMTKVNGRWKSNKCRADAVRETIDEGIPLCRLHAHRCGVPVRDLPNARNPRHRTELAEPVIDNILALDLGTKTGWCFGSNPDGGFMIRTICLAKPAEVTQWSRAGLLRGNDPRISRLYDAVAEFPSPISLIVFEDVVFASTTYQAQLWASLRAAVWLAAAHRPEQTAFLPVPVGTLKKFATGNGAADKQAMKVAAERVGFDCAKLDDNAVDAIHLWRYGFTHRT